ncbi:hypothetical protein ACEVJK_09290, partial [Flintibacter sp. P01028]|uniref:hypothetical protein n=1 Tax=Flintibacter sp. P01028 TaxID=3342382 RepID=UPI0035B648E8
EQGSEGGMPVRAFRGKRTLGEKAAEGGRPKRVRFGEEEQGSEGGMPVRAFRGKRTLFRRKGVPHA